MNTAYGSSGISNLGDEAGTLSDTTSVASVLNTLDGNTSALYREYSNDVDWYGCGCEHSVWFVWYQQLGDEAVTLSDTTLAACSNTLMETRLVLQCEYSDDVDWYGRRCEHSVARLVLATLVMKR